MDPATAAEDRFTWRAYLQHPVSRLEGALHHLDRAPEVRDLDALRGRYRDLAARAKRYLGLRVLLWSLIYVGVITSIVAAVGQLAGIDVLRWLAELVRVLLAPLTLLFFGGVLLLNRVLAVLQTELTVVGIEIAASRR